MLRYLASSLARSLTIQTNLIVRADVPRVPTTLRLPVRYATYANTVSADELWRSVTSKSAAGGKRTGGKRGGTKRRTDLNRGQIMGMGNQGMIWPGLNAPVSQGPRLVSQQPFTPDPRRMDAIYRLRNKLGIRRRMKLSPLERGWTGSRWPGMKIGPPDPIGDYKFEGFQSVVIMFRMVTKVSGVYGRMKSFEAMVVTGNGNGCIGYALGEAVDQRTAIKLAKNRAGQRLVFVDRKDSSTLLHDFWEQHHRTYVYARRQPEGHGVVAHRVIRAICELAGIKDMWAKVMGRPKNYVSVAEAFVAGLLEQQSYQQLADDTGLLVVEQKPECYNYPAVLARPSHHVVRTDEEIDEDEELNVDKYTMHGVYFRLAPKFKPFFVDFPGTKKRNYYDYRRRNQRFARLQRRAQVY